MSRRFLAFERTFLRGGCQSVLSRLGRNPALNSEAGGHGLEEEDTGGYDTSGSIPPSPLILANIPTRGECRSVAEDFNVDRFPKPNPQKDSDPRCSTTRVDDGKEGLPTFPAN